MNKKLPKISSNYKICIICEGSEEYEYIKKLNTLKVWNKKYDITACNAKGNGNIFASYQNKYQNNDYDLVLVFCDTDMAPYAQYQNIKCKINTFHGVDNAADEVIIFGNPCTMMIIIKHWTNQKIKSQSKTSNAPIIQKHTGVKDYIGRKEQIQQIMNLINKANYRKMCDRMDGIEYKDTIHGCSNFGYYTKLLESGSVEWIEEKNNKLL